MRAAVYHRQGELDLEDRPVPELGPRDVLLEVSHCGICGSDIHFVLEGWGQPGSVEGHEWSGASSRSVTRSRAGQSATRSSVARHPDAVSAKRASPGVLLSALVGTRPA